MVSPFGFLVSTFWFLVSPFGFLVSTFKRLIHKHYNTKKTKELKISIKGKKVNNTQNRAFTHDLHDLNTRIESI